MLFNFWLFNNILDSFIYSFIIIVLFFITFHIISNYFVLIYTL